MQNVAGKCAACNFAQQNVYKDSGIPAATHWRVSPSWPTNTWWINTEPISLSGWWLNQPIWKICSSKWESSPKRDENKQYVKPPPSYPFYSPFCSNSGPLLCQLRPSVSAHVVLPPSASWFHWPCRGPTQRLEVSPPKKHDTPTLVQTFLIYLKCQWTFRNCTKWMVDVAVYDSYWFTITDTMETSKDFHDVRIDLTLLMTDHVSQILNVMWNSRRLDEGEIPDFHRESSPKPIEGSHRTSPQDSHPEVCQGRSTPIYFNIIGDKLINPIIGVFIYQLYKRIPFFHVGWPSPINIGNLGFRHTPGIFGVKIPKTIWALPPPVSHCFFWETAPSRSSV